MFRQLQFRELFELALNDNSSHELRESSSNSESQIIYRCAKLVSQNRLSAANAVLDGSTVAHNLDGETLTTLQAKFPSRKGEYLEHSSEIPTFARPFNAGFISFTVDEMLFMAKKTNGFTSPGPSGMTAEALLMPLKKVEQSAYDHRYIEDLKYFIEQLINGDRTCADYFLEATLCPITKPDGGVRPICISETIRRFASKLLLAKFQSRLVTRLGPIQTCLQEAGVEKTVFFVKTQLDLNPSRIAVSLDIANAFNEVMRSRIRSVLCAEFPSLVPFFDVFYANPTKLYVNNFTTSLVGEEGVCQGDPWGPALFCLALSPVLEQFASDFPDCKFSFYADDGCLIFDDQAEVRPALISLASKLMSVGLKMRVSKCVAYSPQASLSPLSFPTSEELNSVDENTAIRIVPCDEGFKLLGAFVGSDAFILEEHDSCVHDFQSALNRLFLLQENPQVAFLLLRFCVNQKLFHLLRSAPPRLTRNMASRVDHLVNEALMKLVGIPQVEAPTAGTPIAEWPTAFIKCRLPGSYGGLGVSSLSAVAEAAFLGGLAASWKTLRQFFTNDMAATLKHDFAAVLLGIMQLSLPSAIHPNILSYLTSRWSSLSKRRETLIPAVDTWSHLSLAELVPLLSFQVVDSICMRMANTNKLQHLLSKITSCSLHGSVLSAISNPFTALSQYRVARHLSGGCNEAMLWTSAVPTSPDMIIAPAQFRILVAQALGNPLPGFALIQHSRCTCDKSLGHEGYHLLSCYRTYAHDKVVKVIQEMCRSTGLVSEVEPVGLMSGEHRPDIVVPNLRADGKSYLGDFASVDPVRRSSLPSSWYIPGFAANGRDQQKRQAYAGHFNEGAFEMLPLIMETTGRMHIGFRRFLAEVATFASKHLLTGGVGQHRFRSRFLKFWKTRIVATFLKALATSAMQTQQAIVDRSRRNRAILLEANSNPWA
jgi:hypothetical protein